MVSSPVVLARTLQRAGSLEKESPCCTADAVIRGATCAIPAAPVTDDALLGRRVSKVSSWTLSKTGSVLQELVSDAGSALRGERSFAGEAGFMAEMAGLCESIVSSEAILQTGLLEEEVSNRTGDAVGVGRSRTRSTRFVARGTHVSALFRVESVGA